jgi:hypothetical protein
MNRSSLLLFPLLLSAAGCAIPDGTLPSRCQAIEVDPMRELVVTDEAVETDPRFGFDRVMGAVLGPDGDSAAFAWMDSWTKVDGEETLRTDVIEPWANASAATNTKARLDLSHAPFELVAIVNRVDLGTLGPSRSAELRFVYGLVTEGERRPLTVNVEIHMPPTRSVADWASAWHALGSLSGPAYSDALAAIVDEVLASPLEGQVRTQDAEHAEPMLLEFDLGQGALVPGKLFDQPDPSVSAAELAAFVSSNETLVNEDEEVLPRPMLAHSIRAVPQPTSLPGVSSELAQTFEDHTCAGCHTAEPTIDGRFHISPLRRGQAALSPFLAGGPTTPEATDELSRRAEVLRGLLCQ